MTISLILDNYPYCITVQRQQILDNQSLLMKVISHSRTSSLTKSVIILLIITFLLNYFFRHHLYNHSIVTVLRLQQRQTPTLDLFFNFLIDLADPRLVGLIFVVSNIVCKDKNYILSLLMYFLGCVWVSVVLKMLYSDPRPFWTSSVVKNLSDNCHFDYGNPFGPTITPILLFESIIVYAAGAGKGGLLLVIPLALTVLIPLAGLYLGIASVNQVLMGIIIHLSALILFKLIFSKLLVQFLHQINHYTEKGKSMMIAMFFLHALTILTPLFIFLYRPKPALDRVILINIGNSCQVVPSSLNDINFQMLILSAILNVCFGYCYGYYVDGKTERRVTKRWSLDESKWWLKFLIDCCLLLLPVVVINQVYRRNILAQSYLVYLLICTAYIWIGYIQIRWSPMLRTPEPRNPLAYDVQQ